MTVSMRVMSAGDGYKYLLRSVAAGDGDRSLSTPLTRYYAEAGNLPGHWIGTGLTVLGDGQLAEGAQVTEEQLQLMIGMGQAPITKAPQGRAYQRFASVAERIESRTKALPTDLGPRVERSRSSRSKPKSRSAVAVVRWQGSITRSVSRSLFPRSGRSPMPGRRR